VASNGAEPAAERHLADPLARAVQPSRVASVLDAHAVKELLCHASGEADARPGIVVSVATAGDLLQSHPHLHVIATDGCEAPTARGTRRRNGTPSG
jgi:hypothetical protein